MQSHLPKAALIVGSIVSVLLIGVGLFLLLQKPEPPIPPEIPSTEEPVAIEADVPLHAVIGTSVEGRTIEAHTYGTGVTHLLFVGGVHGGYEWNSVMLAYRVMDYLATNPTVVPEDVKVTIIPSLNPDGLFDVVGVEGRFGVDDAPDAVSSAGVGRFNANNVDLNRNFDCKWKPESMWRGKVVSAGTAVFSEPEAAALRDYVLQETPDAVVFWHSQANTVYASECEAGILPQTLDIMAAYAEAGGYFSVEKFDAYEVTGDAEGWLASIGVPAITVELETHQTVEWERNRAGVEALLRYYSELI